MSEPLTQAERAELVAEVTRQHEQSAFARKHMDLTDNSLLRYEATVAALTAENERQAKAINEAIGWLTAMLERRQYENDHELRELQDALAAALPSSRETTDGRTDPS